MNTDIRCPPTGSSSGVLSLLNALATGEAPLRVPNMNSATANVGRDFMDNGLVLDHQIESTILQRRNSFSVGTLGLNGSANISLGDSIVANPVVRLNSSALVDRPLQNEFTVHVSGSQTGPSNLSASETLSPPSDDIQIDELFVANYIDVITSIDSSENLFPLQEVLNNQQNCSSDVEQPRSEVRTVQVEEPELMVNNATLPFPNQPMDVDGDANIRTQPKIRDFCWSCHQLTDNCLIRSCDGCGLIFHAEYCYSGALLPIVSGVSLSTGLYSTVTLDRAEMANKCKECINIAAGSLYNREFVDMDENEARIVFSYAATRLAENEQLECFRELPTFANEKLMDLNSVLLIAQQEESFRTIEQFMFAIKMIIHHAHIINSTTQNDTFTEAKLELLLKVAKIELNFIRMCHDCYRNYYEIDDEQTVGSGEDIPCPNPHSLVWAKKNVHTDYWRPAKVYEYRAEGEFVTSQDTVSVIFLGVKQNEPIQVKVSECYMYSKKCPNVQSATRKSTNPTVEQYLRNLDHFFIHDYEVPNRMPRKFNWNDIFIDVKKSKDREAALRRLSAQLARAK